MPTAEGMTPDGAQHVQSTASSQSAKSQRILACVLCQQRKVKCDRKFPCGNCIKSRTQCVPAAQIQRQRKRRFPERELLDRVRKYEDLLRQNNISFEPLHSETNAGSGGQNRIKWENDQRQSAGADKPSPSDTTSSEKVIEAKYGHKKLCSS